MTWRETRREADRREKKDNPAKTGSMKTETIKPESVNQTFSFTAPDARSVLLVGDFTHWQQKPVSLRRQAGGVWETTLELSPGTHHYRFLVDGEWRDDPECTLRVLNSFGSENSVREVKP